MISYITSRKKTIVPSQSLDSVQQQHACKDVYKFFILSKKNRYINHKIITIIHKNQIIRNKKIFLSAEHQIGKKNYICG